MATSVPPPNAAAGWVQTQKSSQGNTRGLKLGMSGLSLMPAFGGGRSNHSQSSVDEVIANMQDARHRSRNNSLDGGSSTGSPTNGPSGSRGIARPPGLGGPGPSLIGKPGHSKNSSASTAQSVTLTPSSSIDGTFDMYRQSSPFHGDGPSMPPLRQNEYKINASIDDSTELPRGITTFGSFDASDRDNDGLLGLDALRDRAQSTPGLSSSPPVPMRGQIAPHGSFHDEMGARGVNPDHHRPRAVSRDSGRPSHSSRPPLSGGSGLSPHTDGISYYGDRNLGSVSIPFSGSRSRDPSPPPNYTQDGNDLRGPGVISRPGLLYGEAPERIQRTISNETGREYMQQNSYNMYQNGNNAGDKFGSLASLGSQMPNQRMYQQGYQQEPQVQMHEMQRHQRSLSQPGPMRSVVPDQYSMYEEVQHRRSSDYGAGFASNRLPPGMDNDYNVHSDMRYNQQTSPTGNYDRSLSGDGHYPPHGRSMSMTHQAMPSQPVSQESQGQRRSSLQMTNTTSGHLHAQAIRRRESLDFVPGHSSRYNDFGVPIVASGDEMRMFGNSDRHDRLVSPAHSPLHVNYGGHSRQHSGQHSDMGSSAMSSSPMSLGSSGMRGGMHGQVHDMYGGSSRGNSSHHRTMSGGDEDLSHPLLGEHIEVPGDDPSYMPDGSQGHGHMRPMGHPMGMDQMQGHYGGPEAAHHLQTAGSALPLPKVVYNVKFKRTQRSFVMGPRINRDLKIGTYVKVEADRGEDLGIVVGKLPSEKYNMTSRPPTFRGSMNEMGIIPPPTGLGAAGASDLKRIIRLATHDEVSLLAMKREEEEELLKICRAKVRQRGLPMHVVDAEYQFDRHKLTFFFEAEGRVDFRELVRDLFSIYKTRIWMQQLDKNTAVASSIGSTPPPPVMMDYGTPIIAPASEFSEFATYNSSSSEDGTE